MDTLALAAFVLAAVALLGSPGPGIAALVAVGRSGGWRAGLRFYGGLQLGLALVAAGCAAGLAAALLAEPRAARVLGWIAAAYLLYLAARIAVAPVGKGADSGSAAASAAGGFLLGISNPKAYVAFVSLMAMRPITGAGGAADAVAKWAVIVAVILIVDFAWLWLGGVIGAAEMTPRAERVVNLALAAALAAVVVAEII
jgi:threonine/homoserine/homoserine lactone efflux protein